jgi:hypothetical protein
MSVDDTITGPTNGDRPDPTRQKLEFENLERAGLRSTFASLMMKQAQARRSGVSDLDYREKMRAILAESLLHPRSTLTEYVRLNRYCD